MKQADRDFVENLLEGERPTEQNVYAGIGYALLEVAKAISALETTIHDDLVQLRGAIGQIPGGGRF